jgi:lysozyme
MTNTQHLILLMTVALILNSCNQPQNQQVLTLLDSKLYDSEPSLEDTIRNKAIEKLKGNSKASYGIDLSHYQGNLMEEISPKDTIKFILCKATQGIHYVDPDFRTNWREIQQKGFLRGAYHFYDCKYSPKAQAEFFASMIHDLESNDISPVLDIEQGSMVKDVSGNQMQSDVLVFLEVLKNKLGRSPIIYTDYAFAQQYFNDEKIAQYDLWLAEYNGKSQPRIPSLWKDKGFLIWQRSDSYHTLSEQVDLDVTFGPLSRLTGK